MSVAESRFMLVVGDVKKYTVLISDYREYVSKLDSEFKTYIGKNNAEELTESDIDLMMTSSSDFFENPEIKELRDKINKLETKMMEILTRISETLNINEEDAMCIIDEYLALKGVYREGITKKY